MLPVVDIAGSPSYWDCRLIRSSRLFVEWSMIIMIWLKLMPCESATGRKGNWLCDSQLCRYLSLCFAIIAKNVLEVKLQGAVTRRQVGRQDRELKQDVEFHYSRIGHVLAVYILGSRWLFAYFLGQDSCGQCWREDGITSTFSIFWLVQTSQESFCPYLFVGTVRRIHRSSTNELAKPASEHQSQ